MVMMGLLELPMNRRVADECGAPPQPPCLVHISFEGQLVWTTLAVFRGLCYCGDDAHTDASGGHQ